MGPPSLRLLRIHSPPPVPPVPPQQIDDELTPYSLPVVSF